MPTLVRDFPLDFPFDFPLVAMPPSVSTALNNGFTLFLSLLVEALPFLLLGVLFSSALLLFLDERWLLRILPRNALFGALVGSAIGMVFPVCECGNVPVARRFLVQGVPASVTVGFLLAAPTINPIVIWSTWTAFRGQPELVVLRVVVSLIIATLAGWVFSYEADIRELLNPALARSMLRSREPEQPGTLLQSGTYWLGQADRPLEGSVSSLQAAALGSAAVALPQPGDRLRIFVDNSLREFRELGGVLILGSAVAAIVQVAVPRETIVAIGQGPITSILAMMILAAAISICSTVDAFFALSFAATFTTGSLLAFMTFGPTIDLKAVGLMLTIFKPRAILYLFAIAAQVSFLAALMVNYWLS
jgi:uncharacterized membrane protein YraQ (UPF0718 family)